MPYTIPFTNPQNPRGSSLTIPDGYFNDSTSLKLLGKNYPGYGSAIAENFLHLLENFASPTQPPTGKSVVGQMWYDTANNQTKVFDGQNYVPAGNVIKSYTAPINKNIGDLWVDLTNKQLYFWSGATWILVGPQFSEGLNSGPVIEQVIDTLNVSRTIIRLVVSGETVLILSKDKFIPKLTIEGFSEINPGANISSKTFVASTANKLWGTAEKANALVVGSVTVDSSKFLRSDQASYTDFGLSIRNDAGLTLGSNNSASITATNTGALVVYNNTDGSSITFKTLTSPNVNDVLTLKGSSVGVNNPAPLASLDVVGTVKVTDTLTLISDSDIASNTSTTNLTGSFKTSGGVSIAKKLFVGSDTTINGTTTVKTIVPTSTSTFNLGDTNKAFNRVYADVVGNQAGTTQFIGNFTGVYTGSISGSATQLASPTSFSIAGDVTTSSPVVFDGATGGTTKVFTVEIDPEFIYNKSELTGVTQQPDDLFLVYQSNTLKKTTRTQLFSKVATVPIGGIMPFAGATAPNGYLLCDGAEILRSEYPELYSIIGNTYVNSPLQGAGTFKLPDLRGRFALGRDTMNNGIEVPESSTQVSNLSGVISSTATTTTITGMNTTVGLVVGMTLQKVSGSGAFGGTAIINSINSSTQITITTSSANTVGSINFIAIAVSSYIATVGTSANRITSATGDSIGGEGGSESTTIAASNLPEHSHDLQSPNNTQFAAVINPSTTVSSGQSGVLYSQSVPPFSSTGALLTDTGGVNSVTLGQPFNVLNPYLTINYIIFTGRFS